MPIGFSEMISRATAASLAVSPPHKHLRAFKVRVVTRTSAKELVTAAGLERQFLDQFVRVTSKRIGQGQGGTILVRPFLPAAKVPHHIGRRFAPIRTNSAADSDSELQGLGTKGHRTRVPLPIGVIRELPGGRATDNDLRAGALADARNKCSGIILGRDKQDDRVRLPASELGGNLFA
ncbi:MAG: hypothetical protein M3Z64_09775 [Verrucomicrobiota bacterium]|nr:hypothetical protein [Verrucomicrobiota bacterium]